MSEGKIREIFERENKWLRCKDVIEKASRLDIGRSTVYTVLRKMVNECILERDRKGKRSSYRLKPETLSPISLLIFKTVDKINDEARKWEGEGEILKGFCLWIGALSLYTTLKSIRKGKPLKDVIEVATYYIKNYVHDIIKGYIIYRETPLLGVDVRDEGWWSNLQLLMSVETGFEDYEGYLPALERFEETLEKLYPDQVKELDKIFNEVLSEGK